MENYKFPIIETINDVLDHIVGKEEIMIFDKPNGLTVIDYMFQTNQTFDNPVARECRGLIFNRDGKLVRRAYHKFFNLGEKEFTLPANVDISKAILMDKLDGSMVTPFEVEGTIRYATRMGITEHAMRAETFAATMPKYHSLNAHLLRNGMTAIYEWLDPNDPIVVLHDKQDLVLTGARNIRTGDYLSLIDLRELSYAFSIPVVGVFHDLNVPPVDLLASKVRELVGKEGVVVRNHDGHMLKIKGDWYVGLHRAKDRMRHPAQFIEMVITNACDDLYGLLPKAELDVLKNREQEILEAYAGFLEWIKATFEVVAKGTRKEFALGVGTLMDSFERGLIFKFFDKNQFCAEYCKDSIIKHLQNNKERDKMVSRLEKFISNKEKVA